MYSWKLSRKHTRTKAWMFQLMWTFQKNHKQVIQGYFEFQQKPNLVRKSLCSGQYHMVQMRLQGAVPKDKRGLYTHTKKESTTTYTQLNNLIKNIINEFQWPACPYYYEQWKKPLKNRKFQFRRYKLNARIFPYQVSRTMPTL